MVDVDHKICIICIMLNTSDVQTPREIGGTYITTASTITDASTTTASRGNSIIDDKKRKIKAICASSSWMVEDPYEVQKVKSLIRTNVFKNLKFVKGEGQKAPSNTFDKKDCEDLTIW